MLVRSIPMRAGESSTVADGSNCSDAPGKWASEGRGGLFTPKSAKSSSVLTNKSVQLHAKVVKAGRIDIPDSHRRM